MGSPRRCCFSMTLSKFTMVTSILSGHFVSFRATENLGRSVSMWETRSVQITVLLPHDIAEQAEEVQKTDPEFLSRVVLYGLTRRSIYHQLRDRNRGQDSVDYSPPPAM